MTGEKAWGEGKKIPSGTGGEMGGFCKFICLPVGLIQ